MTKLKFVANVNSIDNIQPQNREIQIEDTEIDCCGNFSILFLSLVWHASSRTQIGKQKSLESSIMK